MFIHAPELTTFSIPKKHNAPELLIPGRKPVGPVEIDWSNKFSKNLFTAILALNGGILNLKTGEFWPYTDGATLDAGKLSSNSDGKMLLTGSPLYPAAFGFTALTSYTALADGSADHVFWYDSDDLADTTTDRNGFADDVATMREIHFGVDLASGYAEVCCQLSQNISIANVRVSTDETLPIGVEVILAAVNTTDRFTKIYADGVLKNTSNQANNAALQSSAGGIVNNVSETARTNRYMRGKSPFFFSWDRVLSDEEIAEISGNPYQIFKPAKPPVQIPYEKKDVLDGFWLPDPRFERPEVMIPGRKPSGPVEIDWSHPSADGLLFAWVPSPTQGYLDLVTGMLADPGVFDANIQFTVKGGEYVLEQLGGTVALEWDNATTFEGLMAMTVFARFLPNSLSQNRFWGNFIGTKANLFNLFTNSATSVWFSCGDANLNRSKENTSGSLAINKWVTYGGWVNDNGAGADIASIIEKNVATGTVWDGPKWLPIGGMKIGYGSQTGDGWGGVCYIWNRKLESVEWNSMVDDPYQFLIPA